MESIVDEFVNKFNKIKNIGWIKSIENTKGGAGRTFEYMLGNQENSLEIPDYNGIEIKTKLSKKNIYTTLFNCKPESCYYMETERLKNKYGYADRDFPNYKVLNNSVFCNFKTLIGNNIYFQLKVDRIQKKVFLTTFNINGEIIENNVTYWDFDTLEEKLYRKLKTLAYIKVAVKFQNNQPYYKYYKMNLYKLKNFDNFINLIEQGKIRVTFKVGLYKSGPKKGKTYDHGTGFDIKECDLLQLYDKLL